MLKRILGFFRKMNNEENVERKQDAEESLEDLLNRTKYNLAILKEREVKYGGSAPLDLLNQIADHQRAIALIEQAIRGELSRSDLRQKLQPFTLSYAAALDEEEGHLTEVEALRREVEDSLKSLAQTLAALSDQVGSMSNEAKAAAVEVLRQASQQSSALEAEWHTLSSRSEFSEKTLQPLLTKLAKTRQSISILIQRRMHLRNLALLQEQLAQQQTALPEEVLHKTLEPYIHAQQEQIRLLEQKVELTGSHQKLLKIYRRNLELCQQMLAGERAYAPLNILNQIEAQEQLIREIDIQLAGL